MKLINILFLIVTFGFIGILITSCEKEIKPEISESVLYQEIQNASTFKNLVVKGKESNHYELNEKILQNILQQKPNDLQINVPLANRDLELKLEKWEDIEEEDVDVLSNSELGLFYHGTLNNEENSVVALSVFNKNAGTSNESRASKSSPCYGYYKTVRIRYVVDETFQRYFRGDFYDNTPLDSPGNAAGNYISAKFHSMRVIYRNAGVRIRLTGFINDAGETDISGPYYALKNAMYNLADQYQTGSNSWDVLGGILALGQKGDLSGGGIGIKTECYDYQQGMLTAPICKKGANHGYETDCLPVHVIGLEETGSGDPHDHNFIHHIGHELAHNFGLDDTNASDIMGPGHNHNIDQNSTGSILKGSWFDCYCNNQP